MIAKLFAMMLDHKIAVWAEDEGILRDKLVLGKTSARQTTSLCQFVSLIDKQKQTWQGKAFGKLYCCFVDFKQEFDTVPRGLLWQVLERVGIREPILDCIKSLYAHDSAAVRNSEGISEICDCLMGVKQGCPLSATLFGLFVDGLEQHFMDTVGHDAYSLSGILIPLLLYADDLIIMFMTTAGLQRQLDVLQQFVIKDNSLSIWPKQKWLLLDQKLHVKLSHSAAMKWSGRSHTSILGLSFMQPKIWHRASRSLSPLQRKQCIP